MYSVRFNASQRNAQTTVSSGAPEGEGDHLVRAGPIMDEENDALKSTNRMVVDGSMYNPQTGSIVAEGYVDLNQLPDENEGSTHEGDTAACTAWTTAGPCVYGTEANNAQLNEINKTHAGPEFEEVDEPVRVQQRWTLTRQPGSTFTSFGFRAQRITDRSYTETTQQEFSDAYNIIVNNAMTGSNVRTAPASGSEDAVLTISWDESTKT